MTYREINLIPDNILFRYSLVRHLYFWGGILAVMITIIIGINIYMKKSMDSQLDFPEGIEGLDNRLSDKVEAIKTLQEEIAGLDLRMEYAEKIQGSGSCSMMISRFISIMNNRTWLTGLEISREKDNSTLIRMDGFSVGSKSLGEFIEMLSKEEIFASVFLKYAREADHEVKTAGASGLVRFQIELNSRG